MRKLAAHRLVVKTARDMARSLFEEVMRGDNELYKGWKEICDSGGMKRERAEDIFVDLLTPKLLEPARAILAHMLGDPSYAHLHEGIYDSILRDATLRAGRVAPQGRAKLTLDEAGNVTRKEFDNAR